MANLARDGQLLQYVRNIAENILKEDHKLANPENQILEINLRKLKQSTTDWSKIS
jgi:ATP-dependent DNA helicase RecG